MTRQAGPDDYALLLKRYHRQRRIFAAIVVAIILSAVVWGRLVPGNHQAVSDYPRYHDRSFLCVKVIDGDTIDVEIRDLKSEKKRPYTRIRLWGIDTPEMPHHGNEEKYYAREAGDFARKLMQGKMVRLELVKGDTRGYYGRLLAYVYLGDGTLYNRRAIATGHAYADFRYRHPKRQEFLDLEKQARSKLLGLWASITADQLPKWYRKSQLDTLWKDQQDSAREAEDRGVDVK